MIPRPARLGETASETRARQMTALSLNNNDNYTKGVIWGVGSSMHLLNLRF